MNKEIKLKVDNMSCLSPQQAGERLIDMSYGENEWDNIMSRNTSHSLSALVTIARGDEPKLWDEVYKEMRVKSGLAPERSS